MTTTTGDDHADLAEDEHEDRVSLAGVEFEDAMAALLATPADDDA